MPPQPCDDESKWFETTVTPEPELLINVRDDNIKVLPTLGKTSANMEIASLFLRIFSVALMSVICVFTNKYANQWVKSNGAKPEKLIRCQEGDEGSRKRRTNWVDFTVAEFLVFISILIIMSYNILPNVRLYWSTETRYGFDTVGNQAIQKRMSRDRFLDLLHLLCFRDDDDMAYLKEKCEYDENDFNKYTLRKIWLVYWQVCKAIFYFFKWGTWLALDESMLAFCGNLSFKQYMPAKPIKVSQEYFHFINSIYQLNI